VPLTDLNALTATLPVTEVIETITGAITETGVLTNADGIAGAVAGAAAGAAAAVSNAVGNAANSAVCTALGGFDELVANTPTITADTPVSEVQDYLAGLRENNALVTTGLGTLEALNVDLGPVTDTLDELTATVEGLSGDTVGDAAATINTSLTQITDTYAGVRTAAACE
jgi:hypothetical protein